MSRSIVTIKHLSNHSVLAVSMGVLQEQYQLKKPTLKFFMNFIFDENPEWEKGNVFTRGARVALMFPNSQGTHESEVGDALIDVRRQVREHIQENVGPDEKIVIRHTADAYVIDILLKFPQ
jgi:hypothetical protein